MKHARLKTPGGGRPEQSRRHRCRRPRDREGEPARPGREGGPGNRQPARAVPPAGRAESESSKSGIQRFQRRHPGGDPLSAGTRTAVTAGAGRRRRTVRRRPASASPRHGRRGHHRLDGHDREPAYCAGARRGEGGALTSRSGSPARCAARSSSSGATDRRRAATVGARPMATGSWVSRSRLTPSAPIAGRSIRAAAARSSRDARSARRIETTPIAPLGSSASRPPRRRRARSMASCSAACEIAGTTSLRFPGTERWATTARA